MDFGGVAKLGYLKRVLPPNSTAVVPKIAKIVNMGPRNILRAPTDM